MRDRFQEHLGATPAAGILAALAVGDQRAISAEEWRLFNRTGVTHLMSISGLHVTLVSGLAAWLVAFGWRRVPAAALRLPARKAAAAAAIVAALGYTLLAGFAVPAQRTFYMVSVVAVALWSGRIASPARTLALALAVVVAADPWAPLAPGLWLSFGAVALIFYVASKEARVLQWGRMQWAITVGPRAGGAAAVRPDLGRRAARQRGRHPGGVGGRDAARAAGRAAPVWNFPCKRPRGWSSGCWNFSNGARRCPARCGSSTCRRCGPRRSPWRARRGCLRRAACRGAPAGSR